MDMLIFVTIVNSFIIVGLWILLHITYKRLEKEHNRLSEWMEVVKRWDENYTFQLREMQNEINKFVAKKEEKWIVKLLGFR